MMFCRDLPRRGPEKHCRPSADRIRHSTPTLVCLVASHELDTSPMITHPFIRYFN